MIGPARPPRQSLRLVSRPPQRRRPSETGQASPLQPLHQASWHIGRDAAPPMPVPPKRPAAARPPPRHPPPKKPTAQVAERLGTTQSTVARLESGKHPPSLRTVQRFAQAVGDRAVVRIVALSGSVLPYRPPGRGAAEGLGPGRARGTACCRTQCRPASAGWQTHGRLRSTVCCGYSVD